MQNIKTHKLKLKTTQRFIVSNVLTISGFHKKITNKTLHQYNSSFKHTRRVNLHETEYCVFTKDIQCFIQQISASRGLVLGRAVSTHVWQGSFRLTRRQNRNVLFFLPINWVNPAGFVVFMSAGWVNEGNFDPAIDIPLHRCKYVIGL